MLSAYLDDDLTNQQREWVESAIAADEEIAWRLESLRQTVNLLSNLPDIAPRRSFILDEGMVGDVTRARQQAAARRRQSTHSPVAGATSGAIPLSEADIALEPASVGWRARVVQRWRGFWQGGNPVLRNLATASLALALFVAAADTLMLQPGSPASPSLFVMQQESVAQPQAAALVAPDEAASAAVDSMAADSLPGDSLPPDSLVEDEFAAGELAEGELELHAMMEQAVEEMDDPPHLATPALIEGAAEAQGTTVEAAPEAARMAPVAPMEAAPEEPLAEGGFGDAEQAAPGMLGLDGDLGGMGSMGMGGGDGTEGEGSSEASPFVPEAAPAPMPFEPDFEADADRLDAPAIAADEVQAEEIEAEEAEAFAALAMEAPEEATDEAPEEATVEATGETPEAERVARVPGGVAVPTETVPTETVPTVAVEELEATLDSTAEISPAVAVSPGLESEPGLETPVGDTLMMEATEPEATETGATEAEAVTPLAQAPAVESAPQAIVPSPAGPNVLGWVQWGLLLVAVAFSALWWRSRND